MVVRNLTMGCLTIFHNMVSGFDVCCCRAPGLGAFLLFVAVGCCAFLLLVAFDIVCRAPRALIALLWFAVVAVSAFKLLVALD